MPLPADFWTTGWMEKVCTPDFSLARISNAVSAGYQVVEITKGINIVVAAAGENEQSGGTSQGHTSQDVGVFFARRAGDDTDVKVSVSTATWGWLPHTPSAPLGNTFPQPGWYYPPFIGMEIKFGGDTDDGTAGLNSDESKVQFSFREGSIIYNVMHWQPLTFIGTVAEVIGAILAWHGVDADLYINKESFDESFDEQQAYGPNEGNQPFVWFRAQPGAKVSDTLKDIMSHCADFLTIDMSGRVAMMPRILAASTDITLTQNDVVGTTPASQPIDLITNKVHVSHGQWCCWIKNNYSGYDPNFEGDILGEYFHREQNDDSVALFGQRTWNTKTKEVTIGRETVKVYSSEYPMFYRVTQKLLGVDRAMSEESARRTVLDIEQGLLGFDFDIGYRLEDVDLVDHTTPIRSMRCIGKEIDFNSLTIKSALLEEIEAGVPILPGGIWDYLMTPPEPVGETTQLSGIEIEARLEVETTLFWWWALKAELWTYQPQGHVDIVPIEGIDLWKPLQQTLGLLIANFDQRIRNNEEVKVWIRGGNDYGAGPEEITPWRRMPTINPQTVFQDYNEYEWPDIHQLIYQGAPRIASGYHRKLPHPQKHEIRFSAEVELAIKYHIRVRYQKAGAGSWELDPWKPATGRFFWVFEVSVPPGQTPVQFYGEIKVALDDGSGGILPGSESSWITTPTVQIPEQ